MYQSRNADSVANAALAVGIGSISHEAAVRVAADRPKRHAVLATILDLVKRHELSATRVDNFLVIELPRPDRRIRDPRSVSARVIR